MNLRLRALLAAVMAFAVLPAGTASGASCKQGDPSFSYDTEMASFSIALDLRGCSWLGRKKQLLLEGSLVRDGGVGAGGTTVVATCRRGRVCRVRVSVEHFSLEAARYRATIRYVWNRKNVVLGAAKTCVSAAAAGHCADA